MNARWISSRTPPARTATSASSTNSIRVVASVANGLGEKRPGAQRISTIPVPTASRNTHGTRPKPRSTSPVTGRAPSSTRRGDSPPTTSRATTRPTRSSVSRPARKASSWRVICPSAARAQADQRQEPPDQELRRSAGAEAHLQQRLRPGRPRIHAAECTSIFVIGLDQVGCGHISRGRADLHVKNILPDAMLPKVARSSRRSNLFLHPAVQPRGSDDLRRGQRSCSNSNPPRRPAVNRRRSRSACSSSKTTGRRVSG